MKTYCKLGDRATIIRSLSGNEGRVVRIVDDLGSDEYAYYDGGVYQYPNKEQKWGVRSEGTALNDRSHRKSMLGVLPDSWVRPLPKIDEPVMELEEQE